MKKRIATYRGSSLLGLTFGEMLVVAAVIAFLATMFVLSSTRAMVKTKYSRALQEERSLVNALSELAVEGGLPDEEVGLQALADSPNALFDHIPMDPFNEDYGSPHYQYYSNISLGEYQVLIVSMGPDGDADVSKKLAALREQEMPISRSRVDDHENPLRVGLNSEPSPAPQRDQSNREVLLMTPEEARLFIIENSYDPTNGSVSNGDIITPFGYR